MGDTTIEWTDKTWNPVTGCTKVSQGCKNCYAESIANRMWELQYKPNADGTPRKFTDVRCHEDRLNQPFSWRKPQMVFVNSMSDLFHEDVPDEFIDQVFGVMALTPRHTYQVLTKRPERMTAYFADMPYRFQLVEMEADMFLQREAGVGTFLNTKDWPLPNVWLGTSVEDQANADKRIPYLLDTPAHVRFLSVEPMLGPVDLSPDRSPYPSGHWLRFGEHSPYGVRPIHWVIVGGESGRGARRFDPDWARSIRDQCAAAGVAFFMKQLGGFRPGTKLESLPEDLRVRQFPAREAA